MDHTVVWRLWSMLWWGYMSLRHEKVWVWSLCDNLQSAFHNLLIAINSAKQKEIMCKGIPKTARKWVWCLELRCPAGFCCGGDPLRLEGGREEQFWWKNRSSFFVSTKVSPKSIPDYVVYATTVPWSLCTCKWKKWKHQA